MSAEINYKNKYMELRAKYMNDLDMAFRLGFEQGGQQAQMDQTMQAQADAQAMEVAQMQAEASGGQSGQPGQLGGEGGGPEAGGPPDAPGESGQEPGQPVQNGAPEPMAGQPTELDQHISKLEQAIAKSENLSGDKEILKSLENLKVMRKAEQLAVQMKKNELAIKNIAKALHKPSFKMSRQASHNLSSNAKSAVSLQHKIVDDVMKKMEEEERKGAKDIGAILNIEGLTNKG
jgi:hypothetical protein